MALTKEFNAKNGYLQGIKFKSMNSNVENAGGIDEINNKNQFTDEKKDSLKIDNISKNKKENTRVEKTETETIKKKNEAIIENIEPASTNTFQSIINKGGRPKKYEVEKIRTTLYIPEDLMEEMEVTKMKYNGNRTDYILDLIRKDLKENKEEYDQMRKFLKK